MDEWQDCDCQRPDVRSIGNLLTCMGCGSTKPKIRNGQTDTYSPLPSDGDDSNGSTFSDDEIGDDTDIFSEPQKFQARSDNPYVYEKLGQSSIRLLHIRAGDFSDELVCELVQEDINQFPVYDAISYTWADDSGDRSCTKSILLSGQIFKVTTSCHLALQRARLHDTLTVWIDAVCINQTDNAERSHQVQLMARIYARARRVLVYIGEEDNRSSSLILQLGEGKLEPWNFAEVTALLARPYFWRVWVLQEIALAKSAILLCGDVSIPWQDFARLVQELPSFTEMALRALLTRPSPQQTYGFSKDTWSPFEEGAKGINGIPLALSFVVRALRGVEELPRLLDLSSFCEATEPRDKVYALLGLATGTEGYGFFPDYDADLETVYTRTAMLTATSCGVMALLSRAVCRRTVSPSLPWVPDWRSYSPMSLSSTGDLTVLDEIRQEKSHHSTSGSLQLPETNKPPCIQFSATAVCSILDFLNAEEDFFAHFLPAEDSPPVVLAFMHEARKELHGIPQFVVELAETLWLFRAQSQAPGIEMVKDSEDRSSSCFLLSSLPAKYTPAKIAASFPGFDLPFLGLVRFVDKIDALKLEKRSRPEERGTIIEARMSRQSAQHTHPDIRDPCLGQLALDCMTAAQLRHWKDLLDKRQIFGQLIEELHEWQDESLDVWRDTKNSWLSRFSGNWPALLWGLWLVSGFRHWTMQPRQPPPGELGGPPGKQLGDENPSWNAEWEEIQKAYVQFKWHYSRVDRLETGWVQLLADEHSRIRELRPPWELPGSEIDILEISDEILRATRLGRWAHRRVATWQRLQAKLVNVVNDINSLHNTLYPLEKPAEETSPNSARERLLMAWAGNMEEEVRALTQKPSQLALEKSSGGSPN